MSRSMELCRAFWRQVFGRRNSRAKTIHSSPSHCSVSQNKDARHTIFTSEALFGRGEALSAFFQLARKKEPGIGPLSAVHVYIRISIAKADKFSLCDFTGKIEFHRLYPIHLFLRSHSRTPASITCHTVRSKADVCQSVTVQNIVFMSCVLTAGRIASTASTG